MSYWFGVMGNPCHENLITGRKKVAQMSAIPDEKALMKEIQIRFEKKMKESEIENIEFWKSQVDRILALKPEGVAPLQIQIKKLSEMMANRIMMLKKGNI